MDYKKIEKDFIKRTIALVKRYKHDDEYGVTLQLNCLFGTIVFPKNYYYKQVDVEIENNIIGVKIKNIEFDGIQQNTYNLQVILRCLRNGVSHWGEYKNNKNIYCDVNEKDEIIKVTIKGESKNNKSKPTNVFVEVEFDLEKDGLLNFMEKVYSMI